MSFRPAIKNWENMPPAGGWHINYTEQGQVFDLNGSPTHIVDRIRKIQKNNSTFVSDAAIWNYVNSVWCERDPKRCVKKLINQSSPLGGAPRRLGSAAAARSSECSSC